MSGQHDHEQVAVYAAGLLPREQVTGTEAHIQGCRACQAELSEARAVDAALRRMPRELLLDGPPPGGELLLRRTLGQVRREREGIRQQRRHTLLAAAIVGVVGIGAAGVALGQDTQDRDDSPGYAITAQPGAGSRVLTGLNQATGARLTVTLVPNSGWVGVQASIAGLPPGERCMLVGTDRAGKPYVVGSWMVPAPGQPGQRYTVSAGAAVELADVSAVTVRSFHDQTLVAAPA